MNTEIDRERDDGTHTVNTTVHHVAFVRVLFSLDSQFLLNYELLSK